MVVLSVSLSDEKSALTMASLMVELLASAMVFGLDNPLVLQMVF